MARKNVSIDAVHNLFNCTYFRPSKCKTSYAYPSVVKMRRLLTLLKGGSRTLRHPILKNNLIFLKNMSSDWTSFHSPNASNSSSFFKFCTRESCFILYLHCTCPAQPKEMKYFNYNLSQSLLLTLALSFSVIPFLFFRSLSVSISFLHSFRIYFEYCDKNKTLETDLLKNYNY